MSKYEIGRNSTENDALILKSNPLDVWFHLSDLSSAHLVYYNEYRKDLKTLRKNGTIYRMAVLLKQNMKNKLKKIGHWTETNEIVYCFIKDIRLTKIKGRVKVMKQHIIRI